MPSQMEHAMETLMFTFHKYAGDKNYLSKEDLRALMEKEFPGFLEVRGWTVGSHPPHSPITAGFLEVVGDRTGSHLPHGHKTWRGVGWGGAQRGHTYPAAL